WREEYGRKGGAEWTRRHLAAAAGAKGNPDVRWTLAAAYESVGNAEKAAAAAREALTLHPRDPEAYRQISSIFAVQGRIEDAAAALMEGRLITTDPSFNSDLVDLYRRAQSNGCALTEEPNGPAL